jgi:hypothetical protein
MSESFGQFLETVIERCLGEHDLQPPLVVCTVGANGSALVAHINEHCQLVLVTEHRENDAVTLPLSITIVGGDGRTARLVIERDGSIGRFH